MTVNTYLRTKDLAKAVNISVQQVRNYEANGFIPAAERSPSGYRLYTPQHLAALQTVRRLVQSYGSPRTQAIMQAVHSNKLAAALAQIDARHAEIDRTRWQLEQTLAALGVLAEQLPPQSPTRHAELLRVSAAARQAGVTVAAVRFWEQIGLLQPIREKNSRYRLYDAPQLRRLQIIALLRQTNYDFAAIRSTLAELETGQPQRAAAAVEARRNELAKISWQCVAAMAAFYGYVSEFISGSAEHLAKMSQIQ